MAPTQGTGEIRHGIRRPITHPYFFIFVAAVILRLFLFALAVGQAESPDKLAGDAKLYAFAADAIRAEFNFQTDGVRLFGPGYPAMLALMGGLVGNSPVAMIPVQILVTAIGSVLLAMLAFRFTGDRRIATMAGLLNALSFTGAGLTGVFLSDSLFFVLFVIGLLFFLRGLESRRQRELWLAGAILGICALTRSVALFSFAILAVLAVTHAVSEDEDWRSLVRRRVRPFVITTACLLLFAGAWVIRNQRVYDAPYLSWATPHAMARLSATIDAGVRQISFQQASLEFGDSVTARAGVVGNKHKAYAEYARDMFFRVIREHPLASLKTYLIWMDEGVHSDRNVLSSTLPLWEDQILSLMRWAERLGLTFRVTTLSALGFFLLYRRRRRRLALSLASIYLYFALMTGFTSQQGNRVFYPGQIAWATLVAVAMMWWYDIIRQRQRKPARAG